MFREDIKKQYPEQNYEIASISGYINKHRYRHIKKIKPNPQKGFSLGHSGLFYTQMILRRSEALLYGFVESVNSNNPLMAFLSTRGHYETTGSIGFFLKKLRIYYKKSITTDQLHDALASLGAGSRLYPYKEAVSAVQVMSMIDAVDDLLRVQKQQVCFRKIYEVLSDFCHPNLLSTKTFVQVNKVGIVRFRENTIFREKELPVFTMLLRSASLFVEFYDETLRLLQSNEELPL